MSATHQRHAMSVLHAATSTFRMAQPVTTALKTCATTRPKLPTAKLKTLRSDNAKLYLRELMSTWCASAICTETLL